jgi:hypothetical protein
VIQVYDEGVYIKNQLQEDEYFRMALEWCDLGDLGALKIWYKK